MDSDSIIVIGVVAKELEREGVNPIQALRIGKVVAKMLGVLHGNRSDAD